MGFRDVMRLTFVAANLCLGKFSFLEKPDFLSVPSFEGRGSLLPNVSIHALCKLNELMLLLSTPFEGKGGGGAPSVSLS